MVGGWNEKGLGDIAEIRMCKRIFAEQTTQEGDIPFFKIGTFGKEPDAYISRSLYTEFRDKYSFPRKGDILLSAAGTIGRTVIYDGKPAYFQDSNIVWLEIDEREICNEYLYHCYQIMNWASPEGSTISRLYNGIIMATRITLPPLPEQRAIAAVLSDADAYIAALEKLIAKKRAVKQGAMQELLTGKRRLAGFENDWLETTLGEICEIKDGTHQTPHYVDYGIPFFSVENVTSGNFINTKYISLEEHRRLTALYQIEHGDILMTRIGSIGVCKYVDWNFEASFYVSLALLKCKSTVDAKYLSFYSQSEHFQKEVDLNSLQHAIPRKINLGNIALVRLPIPSLDEQIAIAEILSDMDAEIDALTIKLNKANYIKQGMMSELLTGRIRLVETETVKNTAEAYSKVETEPIRQVTDTPTAKGHNQQFDDAVMIAGIVDALYSDQFPLGRKKVQKCLYLLRRHQDESTEAFKKKAAGPYADEVRYKGGEPIARSANYIDTTTGKQGTTFARGKNISQAIGYISSWGKQGDIKWVADKLRFKKVDELELLATVDMAICDLTEAGTPVTVQSIKHLIATNADWKAKLKKQTFSDANIAQAIKELQTLL